MKSRALSICLTDLSYATGGHQQGSNLVCMGKGMGKGKMYLSSSFPLPPPHLSILPTPSIKATHVVDETSTLTPKHLVKLYILLEGVAHLWYSIGLAVGMSESNLTKLKQECWKDKTCLWEVLKVWVEGESPNLEQLAKGLSMIADCSTLVSSINATTLG